MNNYLAGLRTQFDMHTAWYVNALTGISDKNSMVRTKGDLNHMKWVAGHLLNVRVGSLNRICGLEPETTYNAQFERGAALVADDAYPSIEELLAKWNTVSVAIRNALPGIPEQVLATKTAAQLPVGDDTLLGTMAFLMSHEAFHIGQLSVMRQLLGSAPMSYRGLGQG